MAADLLNLDGLVELVDRVEHARGHPLTIGESSAVKAAYHTAGSISRTTSDTRGVDSDRFCNLLATAIPELAEHFRALCCHTR